KKKKIIQFTFHRLLQEIDDHVTAPRLVVMLDQMKRWGDNS
ncbi:9566_t:CDS:1, partial [Racocetra fulgida]